MTQWQTCGRCAGTGMLVKVDPLGGDCPVCGGSGKPDADNPDPAVTVCAACQGTGAFSQPTGEACPACEGKGQVPC